MHYVLEHATLCHYLTYRFCWSRPGSTEKLRWMWRYKMEPVIRLSSRGKWTGTRSMVSWQVDRHRDRQTKKHKVILKTAACFGLLYTVQSQGRPCGLVCCIVLVEWFPFIVFGSFITLHFLCAVAQWFFFILFYYLFIYANLVPNNSIILFPGNYKKCNLVSVKINSVSKQSCDFLCDVTNAATTASRILSKIPASSQPSICDVKVFWYVISVAKDVPKSTMKSPYPNNRLLVVTFCCGVSWLL